MCTPVIVVRDLGKPALVEIDDVARLAGTLVGVRHTAPEGLAVSLAATPVPSRMPSKRRGSFSAAL
jgi:hypothetical protein